MRNHDRIQPEGAPVVILIEPSRVLRDSVKTACERVGLRVVFMADVPEALACISRSVPVAVLVACELPGLPGEALVACLKSCAHLRAIPVALLTSQAESKYSAGVYQPEAVIVKDGSFDQHVRRFLAGLGPAAPEVENTGGSTSEAQELPLAGARVLVADDSAMMRKLIARYLHSAGAQVTLADDGRQAVEIGSQLPFDLILMDIEMPEMDGRQVVRILRARAVTTPTVALTGHEGDHWRDEIMAYGFDGVLTKPVARELLIQTCGEGLARAAAEKSA